MQSSTDQIEKKRSFYPILLRFLGVSYFVLLGCIIAYLWLFTQDRFISNATFKVSLQNTPSGAASLTSLVLPAYSDWGSIDSQIAIGFVDSTDLLLSLDHDFKLDQHYSAPSRDFVFRLKPDATLEEKLEYYRKRINAHFDKDTGLTNLKVDTFDPKLSQELAKAVLERTENFINTLNQTIADQQMGFINKEVAIAQEKVQDATLKLLALQNAHNLVSPDAAISASLGIVQQLKIEQLGVETTLASLERDSPDSPRIATLRSTLRSLAEQVAIESTKISGPEKDRLNQILAQFKELQLKLEFAIRMRTGAEEMLERHRVETVARTRFLSVIQRAFLPEDVGYPLRPYATATILAIGILLFLILRVFAYSVYERHN